MKRKYKTAEDFHIDARAGTISIILEEYKEYLESLNDKELRKEFDSYFGLDKGE